MAGRSDGAASADSEAAGCAVRILQACGTPLAAVHVELAEAINRHTRHESCVLSDGLGWHRCYKRKLPSLHWWNVSRVDDVAEALDWADVVHCHANVSARTLGRPDLLLKKRWIFQWHGMQVIDWRTLWLPEDEPHVRWAHIGQGWIGHCGQAEWFDRYKPTILPNVITVDDEYHSPRSWSDRLRGRVAFAPSTWRKAPNDKGAKFVRDALAHVDLDVISGVQFDECMERKSRAWVGIDEVATPMYHKSGLEFLSLGVACVERIGEEAEAQLKDVTGASSVPFVRATSETLASVVDALLADERAAREIGEASRRWMWRHYHPSTIVKRYVEFYERHA